MSRYFNRVIIKTNDDLYTDVLERRDVRHISLHALGRIGYPSVQEAESLQKQPHIWTMGDRLSKLAERYYNDPRLWWVIAWFNKKPTDAHFHYGDLVYIPMPLETAVRYFNLSIH